jgi:hypothetical protein
LSTITQISFRQSSETVEVRCIATPDTHHYPSREVRDPPNPRQPRTVCPIHINCVVLGSGYPGTDGTLLPIRVAMPTSGDLSRSEQRSSRQPRSGRRGLVGSDVSARSRKLRPTKLTVLTIGTLAMEPLFRQSEETDVPRAGRLYVPKHHYFDPIPHEKPSDTVRPYDPCCPPVDRCN